MVWSFLVKNSWSRGWLLGRFHVEAIQVRIIAEVQPAAGNHRMGPPLPVPWTSNVPFNFNPGANRWLGRPCRYSR